MLLKKGSRGSEVKQLQGFLGLSADGIFGSNTEITVKKWQEENGLTADGLVGKNTWAKMGLASTEQPSKKIYKTNEGLSIEPNFLSDGQYLVGPTEKEYLFIHHTAGWHNPYNVVRDWNGNSSQVSTEFVIGGQSIKGNSNEYDGKVIQAFPKGSYGWHLGDNGSQYMHEHSIGIEVCNFGFIKDGKTYAGTTPDPSQLVEIDEPFRGYKVWHRYSNKQIESLKKLILFIADRDNIDVHDGLIEEIKKHGVKAFEFNEDAYYGRIKGMWTHTNTRKDKSDMFPQQELLDMLLSL
jgi:N-acetyl-anhydromuramyl-L-alanine amidase AmpD